MVLLPGVALATGLWAPLVDRYRGRYELHMLVPAGFGAAPPLSTRPLLPVLGRALAAYLAAHPPTVLIGHSFGAHLALVAATEVAGLARLLLIDGLPRLGPLFFPDALLHEIPELARLRQARRRSLDPVVAVRNRMAAFQPLFANPEDFRKMAPEIGESDPDTVNDLLFELAITEVAGLSGIQAETLVLLPDLRRYADGAHRRTEFERQYAPVPRHRLQEVPGAIHFPMFDAPEAFFSRVDAFLAA